MKKQIPALALVAFSLILLSWGYKGHRAVATIAQQHLSSNTAYVVSAYLKGESMADVSTWADEHKNPTTGKWHFLNLPLGLNYQQFVDFVSQQSNDNIYAAILKEEAILKDKASTSDQKNNALKYLIHLVGDAHQPMHVSRKEDKGGNTIQVRFDKKGTNLHSLWDSKLIDHEGLSETDIVKNYDLATAAQIKQWQADSPMEWLWESYQISSELYATAKPGAKIDETYYQKYIPVTRKRIDQAGIRLAGELNKLFNTATAPVAVAPVEIKLEDIKNAAGKTVTVSGKVYGSKDIGSMVLLNLGAAYPNQLLKVALKGKAKDLGALLADKTITVTGEVNDYKGKMEIIVSDPANIKF